MVDWYNPFQLARTAVDVVVSALLGTRADFRVVQALAGDPKEPFNYDDQNEIWFDYVADLGDGWNPTYAVACLLARDSIEFLDSTDRCHKTHRGPLLIMGGTRRIPSPHEMSTVLV